MRKKIEINDTDRILFRSAMKDVKPIQDDNKITPPKLTLPRRKPQLDILDETTNYPFSDYEKLPSVSSEEIIEFARTGVQHKVLHKLRTGQYTIDATLDLHGMDVETARTTLSHFLQECQRQKVRHAIIIHGKGRRDAPPILKNKLNHWLRQVEQVVAFCSATARHGSGGALSLLLRITRGDDQRE